MEAIFGVVFLATSAISYVLAKAYLFYGFEQSHTLSLVAFIIVATTSIGLLEMVVMEILGISTDSVRSIIWTILIACQTWSTLFMLPGLIIRKLVAGIKNKHLKWIMIFILFSIYCALVVVNLGKEAVALNREGLPSLSMFSIPVQFSFVSKFGVAIISLLSGFSIVYMPYEYFRYYDTMILNINKSAIEQDMAHTIENIRKEKMSLAQINLEHEKVETQEQKGLMGYFMTAVFGSKQSQIDKTIDGHKRAVKMNQQILNNLFLDYSEILKEEKNMMASKNNRCWSFLEKTLAICLVLYGGYKALTTLIYLLLGRNKPSDPISMILQLTVK